MVKLVKVKFDVSEPSIGDGDSIKYLPRPSFKKKAANRLPVLRYDFKNRIRAGACMYNRQRGAGAKGKEGVDSGGGGMTEFDSDIYQQEDKEVDKKSHKTGHVDCKVRLESRFLEESQSKLPSAESPSTLVQKKEEPVDSAVLRVKFVSHPSFKIRDKTKVLKVRKLAPLLRYVKATRTTSEDDSDNDSVRHGDVGDGVNDDREPEVGRKVDQKDDYHRDKDGDNEKVVSNELADLDSDLFDIVHR